jgi:hypothetical protein
MSEDATRRELDILTKRIGRLETLWDVPADIKSLLESLQRVCDDFDRRLAVLEYASRTASRSP